MFLRKAKLGKVSVSVIGEKPDVNVLMTNMNKRYYRFKKLAHGEVSVGFSSLDSLTDTSLTEVNAYDSGLVYGRLIIAKGVIPAYLLKSALNTRHKAWLREAGVSCIPAKVKEQLKEEVIDSLSDRAETKVGEVEFAVDPQNDLVYASCSAGGRLDELHAALRICGLSAWVLNPWTMGGSPGVCSDDLGSLFLLHLLYRVMRGDWESAVPTCWAFSGTGAEDKRKTVITSMDVSQNSVKGAFLDEVPLKSIDLSVVSDRSARPFVMTLDSDWNLSGLKFQKDCSDTLSRRDHMRAIVLWLSEVFDEFRQATATQVDAAKIKDDALAYLLK